MRNSPNMSDFSIETISRMIEDEEGGWVLTDHPDDPDIATYGGMRFITFRSYMRRERGINIKLEDFIRWAKEGNTHFKKNIIEVYYIRFWKTYEIENFGMVADLVLSAVVNIHYKARVRIIQTALNSWGRTRPKLKVDGALGSKTKRAIRNFRRASTNTEFDIVRTNFKIAFIRQWMHEYVKIVRNNARAWQHRAKGGRKLKEPRVLHANNLGGWWNRVNKYLD